MSGGAATSIPRQRSLAVVTGTRAEFGLLSPVMRAIAAHDDLRLEVLVTGTHLLGPAHTMKQVAAAFAIAAAIPMQEERDSGAGLRACTDGRSRHGQAETPAPLLGSGSDEALALGRGIVGFARRFASAPVDFVLVLGDRIEAFAAASSAAVSGIRVVHMHGGDRAEGLVDESLRHAISKIAHLHLPATATSAHRLIAMGEEPSRVRIVGSPAIDGLAQIAPMNNADFASYGSPQIVVLLHPVGDDDDIEHDRAARLLSMAKSLGPTLAMHPNHDPGRAGIMRAVEESGCGACAHRPRDAFVSLLRRAKTLVGNSSAGLIEAAAIPIWTVNVGRRQSGRERAGNVIDIENWDYQTIESVMRRTLSDPIGEIAHPFGDGRTGERVAELLATIPLESVPLRKRNTY